MLTIDLHLHTRFSDGTLTVEQMVDLCGRAGLDAIAITDHICSTDSFYGISAKLLRWTLTEKTWPDYVREVRKMKNRAWRDYKMIVYLGSEFSRNTFSHNRNAHVIALNAEEFNDPNQSEEDWLAIAKAQGAFTIGAHPMKVLDASSQTYYLLEKRETFEPLLDVWEVANARTFWRDMLKTGLPLIASSDLHKPSKWPGWRTRIDCDKDPDAILSALKDSSQKQFVFISGKTIEIDHIFEQEVKDACISSSIQHSHWSHCHSLSL